ncbi:hypothetical protein [Nocardioides dilutus]
MTGLKDALNEIVADFPPYGDLDRAIKQAAREQRRRRLGLVAGISAAAAVTVIAGTLAITRENAATRPTEPLIAPTEVEPTVVRDIQDGPLEPGRYRYVLKNACEDVPGCSRPSSLPPPLDIEVTVPAGWQQLPDFPNVVTPESPLSTQAPDGAALVLGWTNIWAELYADPCLPEKPGRPDITVGPSVDDFVEAVRASRRLDVTPPVEAHVGGHPARFFTLRVPADISGCEFWRPWEPSFYAQGPSNIWDVWVIDVDGFRVLIVTNYFPGTPTETVAELHEMVESIGFRPRD